MISLMHWTWTLDYSNSPLGLFWLCERIAGVAMVPRQEAGYNTFRWLLVP